MYQLVSLLLRLIDIYSLALVVYALLSWFPGGYESGLGRFLERICEPFLQIFRRLNLNFAGLDFSILVAMFSLQILSRIIVRLFYLFL